MFSQAGNLNGIETHRKYAPFTTREFWSKGFETTKSSTFYNNDEGKSFRSKKNISIKTDRRDLKKINEVYQKTLDKKTIIEESKDKEIEELNGKIQSLLLENYQIQKQIEQEAKIKTICEEQQTKIANYCNDIKYKYRNQGECRKKYIQEIERLERENNELLEQKNNFENIQDKELKVLQEKLKNRKIFHDQNKAKLIEWENKVDDMTNEIQRQKNNYQERAEINQIKFDELKKKYENLEKKINELQNEAMTKKKMLEKRNKQMNLNFEQKDEIEKEITEYQRKNQNLQEKIELLKKRKNEELGINFKNQEKTDNLVRKRTQMKSGSIKFKEESFSKHSSFSSNTSEDI